MAQFDLLIIFPLLWSLLITLTIYYNVLITLVIPNFFSIKKFRKKKSNLLYNNKFFVLTSNTKFNTSYNVAF